MDPRAREFYEKQYSQARYAAIDEDRAEHATLRAFIERFDLDGEPVLELGCGRGTFKDVTPGWVGVDVSAAAAREAGSGAVAATAGALPFADESFAAVWSITVLEHVPQPEKALREISRVLRPGGVALLAPAWHCRSWAANGYHVRPWSDFGWRGKLIKASIPARNALWYRAMAVFPARTISELRGHRRPGVARPLRYGRLQANYRTFWAADSDACNSLDPHEMIQWFRCRGWAIPSHPRFRDRYLVRHGAIMVRKPD